MYPVLACLFFVNVLMGLAILILLLIRRRKFLTGLGKFKFILIGWYGLYFLFILFGTGPVDLMEYPKPERSQYRLPWYGGVERFVAQGNRSFTSHRGVHEVAWDFVMPNGTVVLAAREGVIESVDVSSDGIGFNSNFILIKHEDGDFSGYAHLKQFGSLVQVGDVVNQGQPIGYSGMVGQTIFPHLHFFVTTNNGTESKKISFNDVPGGVPLAGHFYTSGNAMTAN